jgi:hypothetical protein
VGENNIGVPEARNQSSTVHFAFAVTNNVRFKRGFAHDRNVIFVPGTKIKFNEKFALMCIKMFCGCDSQSLKYMALFVILVFLVYFFLIKTNREHYRDPIYLNRRKMLYDWYPRSNGSIYGIYSHLLSGFPYYNKAY